MKRTFYRLVVGRILSVFLMVLTGTAFAGGPDVTAPVQSSMFNNKLKIVLMGAASFMDKTRVLDTSDTQSFEAIEPITEGLDDTSIDLSYAAGFSIWLPLTALSDTDTQFNAVAFFN